MHQIHCRSTITKRLTTKQTPKKSQNRTTSDITDEVGLILTICGSPDLTNEILTAVMESMDAQTELSTRAVNSGEIREGLKLILLDRLGLYEKLRTRATSA